MAVNTVPPEPWRTLGDARCAFFGVGSLRHAARFAVAVADLPADLGAGLELRQDGVLVRLVAGGDGTAEAVIGALATEHGLVSEPSMLQLVQVTIDALNPESVKPFWRAVLGYVDRPDSPEDLVDPRRRRPSVWFQNMDRPRLGRNRIHLDVWVAPERVEQRVADALAAGGCLTADHGPTWWVLADAEGNEVCVTSSAGRG
jgi:4a-hydroxytetrahydrobiopterin dehydratase